MKTVRLRSDTAGYQHDLMAYCDLGENERFGRIEFAIGADVTPEFKKAVQETEEWHSLFDKRGHVRGEWAEVCFVPNKSATKKESPTATRRPGAAEAAPPSLHRLSPFSDHRLR